MSALPPPEAIALAVRCLEARGFSVQARNARGDSLYLVHEARAAVVRVSNHARTPKQRRKHPEVTTSLVIREPKSEAQVEKMVARVMTEVSLPADDTGHRHPPIPER